MGAPVANDCCCSAAVSSDGFRYESLDCNAMRTGDFRLAKRTAITSVSFTLASKKREADAGRVCELFSHAKVLFVLH